ncbi:MAG: PaaI family thioesterase [Acidobacteriales bacterium]|nr:PaaI family thioesterase [Terriglobales bacterium]
MNKPKSAAGHDTQYSKIQLNECFACGPDNPQGMALRFTFDEEKHQALCLFKLDKRFQGPPGHSHGGIIATILDEAMGKVNKLRSVIALTKSMNIEYMKPVPLNAPLLAVGFELAVHGRQHHNGAEIRDADGQVLARSEGVFIAVDPKRLAEKLKMRSSESKEDGTSSKPLK